MLVAEVADPGPQSTLPGVRTSSAEPMFGLGQTWFKDLFSIKYIGWAAVFALVAAGFFFLSRAKASSPQELGRMSRRRPCR